VLHYEVGEQITEHFDFVNPRMPSYDEEIRRRGERIITFLIYLNDDYEGGETDFPLLGVRHKGRRGQGLFFVNALPSGGPDSRTVHAGRPPTRGEKWLLSQFIRSRASLNTRAERVA
jgi:prolyl 4-hydroxylase